jgi:glycerol uptake facilitator-like aquaporin
MTHQPDVTPVQMIANPAVTTGRAVTDTFAGIAPGSVLAQLAGLVTGAGLLPALYPDAGRAADRVVVDHPTATDPLTSGPPRTRGGTST